MATAISAATSSPVRSCQWAAAIASARPDADKTSTVTAKGDGLCEIRAS